ncbi:hypothetical protein [Hyalangium versicolor]|uniref:hypothetical protein n=1 Tax=Hyalangium versicolor TaxID=2861190 RepID=UPI001CC9CB0A|nr:hypothetical protein [Hyalangium versicolor]
MPTEYHRSIKRAMLRFIPCPKLDGLASRPDFSGWGLSRNAVRLLLRDPNAFLLGGVFDRLVTVNRAWECPALLADRLGHLDVRRIAKMSERQLARVLGRQSDARALHRFPSMMARCVISACKRLVNQYDGSAANIWKRNPGANEVLRRLDEFEGISQKIAHMVERMGRH